eukprot:352953-Chlamydomonas_euryale.AAC.3
MPVPPAGTGGCGRRPSRIAPHRSFPSSASGAPRCNFASRQVAVPRGPACFKAPGKFFLGCQCPWFIVSMLKYLGRCTNRYLYPSHTHTHTPKRVRKKLHHPYKRYDFLIPTPTP